MRDIRNIGGMAGGRNWIVIGTLILAICVLGCLAPAGDQAEEGKIGVIVSILPQVDFVEQIGGEHVAVTVMVPPGASPHTYEPTAGQLREVSKAQMYAKVGSGVEFELAWFDKIRAVNRNMLIVDCSKGIELIHGADEHDHGGADPHIWTSPRNARIMVENICAGLIEIDPEHEAEYIANRDRYLQELDALDVYIHERLDPYTKKRVFLIYHPSFGYFAAEYNLTQIAIEQEGKVPSPKVIQDCIDYARQYNLSYVYVAPQFATQNAEMVAHEIGGRTVFIDPLPLDYSATMRSVAASLALEMEY
ncbi:MAG: zinc ABC transporter substrate-binding protein [Methanophagales archaeon ANME-1-THS]|nr:MAG: zinc ABC transporter substrate-binding protein [Methanophagales archaeon ANME-1-THS]